MAVSVRAEAPSDTRARGSATVAALRTMPRIPAAIVLVSVVTALAAALIAPHGAIDPDLRNIRKPPVLLAGGSARYPLGTDWQGRDVLSRIIVGTRVSLGVAGTCILLGGLVGGVLGLLAGYCGGWVGTLIMRSADVSLAFPSMLLALIFAVTVGPSFSVVVVVLAFLVWARYARLVRGEVLSIKQREFVDWARVAGASPARVILVHIMPNLLSSVLVLSTLQIGWAILVEASLSFLGAGIPPPTPTWGGMVADGRNYVDTLWWISVFPGIAVMLVVLSFNLLGDWLRDILDPRSTPL